MCVCVHVMYFLVYKILKLSEECAYSCIINNIYADAFTKHSYPLKKPWPSVMPTPPCKYKITGAIAYKLGH